MEVKRCELLNNNMANLQHNGETNNTTHCVLRYFILNLTAKHIQNLNEKS